MKINSIILAIALYGAIVFSSESCSPEQRLTNLIKNHPELIKHDTIFRSDTIKIKQSIKDTIFKNQVTRDTLIIKQDHLTIKYFNSRDSVFVSGRCDSIIKIVKVPLEISNFNITSETSLEKFWRVSKDYLIVGLLSSIIVLMLLIRRSMPKI